jgi:hypothetical protein
MREKARRACDERADVSESCRQSLERRDDRCLDRSWSWSGLLWARSSAFRGDTYVTCLLKEADDVSGSDVLDEPEYDF